MAAVHELGYGEMPRAVVFRGTRELHKAEVQAQLGLNPAAAGGGGGGPRTPRAQGNFYPNVDPNPQC